MAKKVATLEIGSGQTKKLNPKDYNPPKGRIAKHMIAKFTVPVANATGGALASGLSAARKLAVLNAFLFNVGFGKNQERKPYVATTGSRMRNLARDAINSEIEGWGATSADGSTGMERALPDATTTNVVFYLPIPLSHGSIRRDEQHLFGMGRTQQRSMEIEVKRVSDAIDTGLTISGNVTVEFYPQYESCKGDVVGLVPFYRETTVAADDATLDNDGLPLLLTERTAAHASSSLTNVSVWVDGEEIHDQVHSKELQREFADDWRQSSAGLITDVDTVLYKVPLNASLRFLQTGRMRFRQNVKNLTNAALALWYVPYFSPDEIDGDVVQYGELKGGKLIRAASAGLFQGIAVPKRTQGLPAYVLYDADERERASYPGLEWAQGMSKPLVKIPGAILGAAQSKKAAFKTAGEDSSASNVVKELAAIIPGGTTDGRGARGEFSPRLAAVSGLMGS